MSIYQPGNSWISSIPTLHLNIPDGYDRFNKRGNRLTASNQSTKEMKVSTKKLLTPKHFYSLIFLDIAHLKSFYDSIYSQCKEEYYLKDDEYETSYDWIINEAISKLFTDKRARVENHFRHDTYKCIYSEIGTMFEDHIRALLESQNYGFLIGSKVKTLITFNTLIIGRSNG